MINYENVKKVIKTVGDIAGAISLVTGVAGVGFKLKDAFSEHAANKANLENAQNVDLSDDIPENNSEELAEG